MIELLSIDEMRRADAAAMQMGIAGTVLMAAAGAAVARTILQRRPDARRVDVLAGPGNNGGDGYVAARCLADAGREVRVFALGDPAALGGDAAWAAAHWAGPVEPLDGFRGEGADVVVDALFGAGLTRPVEGEAAAALDRAAGLGVPLVAVDVPSGLSGDTGRALGACVPATVTVTFARAKPGHLLHPGRRWCGDLVVADIGIPDEVIARIAPMTSRNVPGLWRASVPVHDPSGHKYSRGFVLAVSGPEFGTGAIRLAARAAQRAGAGLVTIAGDEAALRVHAAHVTGIMLALAPNAAALGEILARDPRIGVVVIGPALGREAAARAKVEAVLASGRAAVLDADALTAYSGDAAALAAAIRGRAAPVVITPHDGEFARLFAAEPGVTGQPSKLHAARAAAAMLGAIVVSKGPDTVVAAPAGAASIAANATADLATAGSGDVLAGLVAGLLAQGMPAYLAASAAVWIHAEAGAAFGRGLIADDLPDLVPAVLRTL